jgi:hypothetical protein
LPYEVYREERQLAIEAEHKQADNFDVNLLYLSGGALGLSMAFVKDMLGDSPPAPYTQYALVGSWVCFGAAILATMTSFHTSQKAYRRHCDALDADQEGKQLDERNFWGEVTSWLNATALAVFLLGCFCLGIFSFCNIGGFGHGKGDSGRTETRDQGEGRIRSAKNRSQAAGGQNTSADGSQRQETSVTTAKGSQPMSTTPNEERGSVPPKFPRPSTPTEPREPKQ